MCQQPLQFTKHFATVVACFRNDSRTRFCGDMHDQDGCIEEPGQRNRAMEKLNKALQADARYVDAHNTMALLRVQLEHRLTKMVQPICNTCWPLRKLLPAI